MKEMEIRGNKLIFTFKNSISLSNNLELDKNFSLKYETLSVSKLSTSLKKINGY